jgi:hypothetical protein
MASETVTGPRKARTGLVRLVPAVSTEDFYGFVNDLVLHRWSAVCVDLDRVDPRIRSGVVRELALGSRPAKGYRVEPQLRDEIAESTLPGLLLQCAAAAAVFVPLLLACGYLAGGYAGVGIAAILVCLLGGVAVLVIPRRGKPLYWRAVEFGDAIIAEVAEWDMGDGARDTYRRATKAIRKLRRAASTALTPDVWTLGYQVGADLAVAHQIRTVGDPDTTSAADRLERRAADIADQLANLVDREIDEPQRRRKAARDEQRRRKTRQRYSAYLGPELPGRYANDTQPTDHYQTLPAPTDGAGPSPDPARRMSWLARLWRLSSRRTAERSNQSKVVRRS